MFREIGDSFTNLLYFERDRQEHMFWNKRDFDER